MRARLQVLAQQRAELLVEIDQQRGQLRARAKLVRQDLAYAAAGFLVARVLARRPWLRALALASLAFAASRLRPNDRGESQHLTPAEPNAQRKTA